MLTIFMNVDLSNGFLNMPPKVQATKKKKIGFDQNLCIKDTILKVKRQPTEREKIFANSISNKSRSKIHKELFTIQQQKTTHCKNVDEKDVNIHFFKRHSKRTFKWPSST